MEIAKEQIFFFFFFVAENGPTSPDTGKRHFNKSVARKFGILPPHPPRAVACKRLLFHKYKLSFLCHPNPHFTLAVMWAHWTRESHMWTNKWPGGARECVCPRVCEGETVITSGRCRWRSLHRYQLRRRLPVSPVTELDQIQGRTEGQGIWAWLMLASLSFPKYLLGRGRLPEYHVMAILLVYRWYYNHTSV